MRVLVVGSGGREHALVWKLAQSPLLTKLFIAPGNGGTGLLAENVDICSTDSEALVSFAQHQKIDLMVIGPEHVIEAGIADFFRAAGIPVFGPSSSAGRLETSKYFSRTLSSRLGIPSPEWRFFTKTEEALDFAMACHVPWVVKYDGLAAGKGVTVPDTCDEMVSAIKTISAQWPSSTVILEERMVGDEFSFFALSDGSHVVPLRCARDYKRAFTGSKGPNTGGMGAVCPVDSLIGMDTEELANVFVRPIVNALNEAEMPFVGVIFVGLMKTDSGIKLVEYNSRFGDPETQVLMMLMESDFLDIAFKTATGGLSKIKPVWRDESAVCVAIATEGYPITSGPSQMIDGLDKIEGHMFHAATKIVDGRFFTDGGRVLNAVGLGSTVTEARSRAYDSAKKVSFQGMFFRDDIAAELT